MSGSFVGIGRPDDGHLIVHLEVCELHVGLGRLHDPRARADEHDLRDRRRRSACGLLSLPALDRGHGDRAVVYREDPPDDRDLSGERTAPAGATDDLTTPHAPAGCRLRRAYRGAWRLRLLVGHAGGESAAG